MLLDIETYSSDPSEEKGATHPFLARVSCASWTLPSSVDTQPDIFTMSIRETHEAGILGSLFKAISSGKTPLVTFNGQSFDLPILAIRGVALGLELPGVLVGALQAKPWELQWHVDLRRVVTFGNAFRVGTLDEVCRCFGIDSPKAQMSGEQAAEIAANVASGTYDPEAMREIEAYNAADVLALVRLWSVLKKARLL